MKKKYNGLVWLTVFILGFMFACSEKSAIEEPEFTVISSNDDYEIRKYSKTIVAETVVQGEFDDAGNRAFRKLADYIFGNNVSRTKMEMTAPVNSQPNEKMEMTAPVQMKESSGSFLYQFVLPARYTLETAPKPVNPEVKLRQLPPRIYAVLQYSGTWSEDLYREKLQELQKALKRDEIKTTGQPVFARYNSPFSLWFLRRNEILIQIEQ